MINPDNHIRPFLNAVSPLIPAKLIFSLSKKRIILPAYHLICNDSPAHIKNLYEVKNEKSFIEDLDFFLKFYTPIDLYELKKFIDEDRTPDKNYFHLSFDDGLSECHDIIAPILQKKGIPATFFLNSAFIDNKGLMFRYNESMLIETINKTSSKDVEKKIEYELKSEGVFFSTVKESILSITYKQRELLETLGQIAGLDFNTYLLENKPYLQTNQVKELIKQGFTIGAHSIDHPQYNTIGFKEQVKQTEESLLFIKNTFSLDYKVFAFPFTDYGVLKKFFNTIFDSSNPVADLTFGGAGFKQDYQRHHLQRCPMEKDSSAKKLITGEYLYCFFKRILGRNKIRRE